MGLEYKYAILFTLFALLLAIVLVLISLIFSQGEKTAEKLSPYECGFNPFGEPRPNFDVKFYSTAVIFLIFDVEVAILIPFALAAASLTITMFFSCVFLLSLVIYGVSYEMYSNVLVWS